MTFFVEKNNFELFRVKLLKKFMIQVNFTIKFQQDPIMLCAFKIEHDLTVSNMCVHNPKSLASILTE